MGSLGVDFWVGVICRFGVDAEKIPRADGCGSLYPLPRHRCIGSPISAILYTQLNLLSFTCSIFR